MFSLRRLAHRSSVFLSYFVACRAPSSAPSPQAAPSNEPTAIAEVVPPASSQPIPPADPARWERASDAGALAIWTRTEGDGAPPLVLRGTTKPVGGHLYPTGCAELTGAREEQVATVLTTGRDRDAFVFARARGPLGLGVDNACVIVAPDTWARIPAKITANGVVLTIADADVPKVRRGQTSPYVIVVSDRDEPPSEEPAPRPIVSPTDVTVRWDLRPAKCGESYGVCYDASLVLGGAFKKSFPLKKPIYGQAMCLPNGTGILCGGASGDALTSVSIDPKGAVSISTYAESDGYCEPGQECGSTEKLGGFSAKPGLHLIPDPDGTFPPAD